MHELTYDYLSLIHKYLKHSEENIYIRSHNLMHRQGGESARDIFLGSGFIHKEYIMSPLTSIINFKHFHSFLASYSKIPTQYFYFERLLPGPMNTPNPGGNHLK